MRARERGRTRQRPPTGDVYCAHAPLFTKGSRRSSPVSLRGVHGKTISRLAGNSDSCAGYDLCGAGRRGSARQRQKPHLSQQLLSLLFLPELYRDLCLRAGSARCRVQGLPDLRGLTAFPVPPLHRMNGVPVALPRLFEPAEFKVFSLYRRCGQRFRGKDFRRDAKPRQQVSGQRNKIIRPGNGGGPGRFGLTP